MATLISWLTSFATQIAGWATTAWSAIYSLALVYAAGLWNPTAALINSALNDLNTYMLTQVYGPLQTVIYAVSWVDAWFPLHEFLGYIATYWGIQSTLWLAKLAWRFIPWFH